MPLLFARWSYQYRALWGALCITDIVVGLLAAWSQYNMSEGFRKSAHLSLDWLLHGECDLYDIAVLQLFKAFLYFVLGSLAGIPLAVASTVFSLFCGLFGVIKALFWIYDEDCDSWHGRWLYLVVFIIILVGNIIVSLWFIVSSLRRRFSDPVLAANRNASGIGGVSHSQGHYLHQSDDEMSALLFPDNYPLNTQVIDESAFLSSVSASTVSESLHHPFNVIVESSSSSDRGDNECDSLGSPHRQPLEPTTDALEVFFTPQPGSFDDLNQLAEDANVDPLTIPHLRHLRDQLLSTDGRTVRALLRLQGIRAQDIAAPLLVLHGRAGPAAFRHLFRHACQVEVASVSAWQTLLRGNSPAPITLVMMARRLLLPTLQELWQDMLCPLVAKTDSKLLQTTSQESIQAYALGVLEHFRFLLEEKNSDSKRLQVLQCCCEELVREVELIYPTHSMTALGGLLILRILGPCLIDPSTIQLDLPLTVLQRTFLVKLTRIIQQIANNSVSIGEEGHPDEGESPALLALLQRLVTLSPQPLYYLPESLPKKMFVTDMSSATALATLETLVSTHSEEVQRNLAGELERNA